MTEQVMLVTGAASGIGLAIAQHFARAGERVLMTDISPSVHDRAEAIGARSAVLDVTDPAAWADLLAYSDPLGSVVLNAGIRDPEPDPARLDPAVYLRVMNVNLNGVVFGICAASAVMTATGGGSMLVIGSMSAVTPLPRDPVYAAAKHGLVGFVRSCAPTLIEHQIRINMLCPGVVETGFFPPGGREQLEAMGIRVMDPSDVAEAAATVLGGTTTGEIFTQTAPGSPSIHEFPKGDRPNI
jgi:NAD(P)-dependent dehydrogenase (short-subunit alcohol dehydrogenase family)